MKMFRRLVTIIPSIIVGGILITGCNEKEDATDSTRVQARISAGIQTRAIDTNWEKNDRIGLHIFKTGTNDFAYNRYNYQYYTPEGSSYFNPNGDDIIYYPLDGSSIDFIGYYPYDATMTEACVCKADVSDQTSLSGIDLMTSERFTGANRSTPDVTIKFHHRLSKLIFKAFYKDKATELPIEKVVIKGMNTAATYNILTETLTVDGNSEKTLEATSRDTKKVEAIVMPRKPAEGVTFLITSGGSEFTAHLSEEQEFKSGFKYTFNLILDDEHGSAPTIKAIIQEWIDGGEIDVESKLVTIDNGPGEAIGFNPGDVITLYHEDMELTKFTYDGTDWTPETPVYWENIGDGVSEDITLRAMFQRADALSDEQMPEVFLGETTTKRYESINLHFNLAPAKIVVKLISESQDVNETFSSDELATATMLLPSYISGYDITNGIFTEGTTTGNINLVDGQALIVPQKKNGTLVTITLNGNQYSVVQEKEQEFLAGKVYTITVNLLKSQLNPAFNVSYTDWTDGDSIGIIKGTPVNIYLSGSTSNFKSGDMFTLYNDAEELTNYTYNGSTWTPAKAIYWEGLTEGVDGKIKLRARFIRHDELNDKQMPEVFLAETTCSRFEAVNLEFKLAPAKIVLKLRSEGDATQTFTAEELKSATIELREYLTEYSIEKGVFVTGITKGNIPVVDGEALIVPQTKNGELATITLKGNKYSVLQVAAQEYQAGKVYTITVNLLKSKVSPAFNLSYTDWTEGDRIGDKDGTPVNIYLSGSTINFQSGDMFTLYNDAEELTNYTYDGSTWTPAKTIYWEDLTAGVGGKINLRGRFIRLDALNDEQMPEVFLAETTCNRFEAINLAFKLVPAKVVVKLTSKSDVDAHKFTDLELSQATIQLPTYITEYSLVGGVFSKGTATGTITLKNGIAHIVPQSKSGTLVEVILNGNKYAVSQLAAVDYQARKIYTITINLLKSGLPPAFNLSYTDWVDGGKIEEDGTPINFAISGQTKNFQNGDKFTLYLDGQTPAVATYTYNGSKWTGSTDVYWEEVGDGVSPTVTFRAEFKRKPKLDDTQLDEMFLAEVTCQRFGEVKLDFKLAPAKVIVVLKSESTTEPGKRFLINELKDAKVLLKQYQTGGSFANGVFTPGTTTSVNIKAVDISGNETQKEALVQPQKRTGILAHITLSGNEYKVEHTGELDLQAGKVYTITVNMLKSTLNPAFNVSYTDWVPGSDIPKDATPVNLVASTGTTDKFVAGNKIKLYDVVRNVYLTTYEYKGSDKWEIFGSEPALYWEDIGDGFSSQVKLRAEFIRTDKLNDTQLPELFLAEATCNRFGSLSFQFKLVPAKVSFVLKSEGSTGDLFTPEELNGATITLPDYKIGYTLVNGVFTETSGIGSIDIAKGRTALIIPQTITGKIATIRLLNVDYEITDASGIEFKESQHTIITVNIVKTNVTTFSASYADWEEVPSGTYDAFKIVTGDVSTNNFKEDDKLSLYYNNVKTSNKDFIAEFKYEGENKWVNTNSESTKHYWQNLNDQNKYIFYAVSTLKSAPDSSNQMDDVMYAECTGVDKLGAITLAFTKMTSKINVVLKSVSDSGNTFTDSELRSATVTLPGYEIGAKYNGIVYNNNGTTTGNITANETTDTEGKPTWTALFEPQTINATNVEKTVLIRITISGVDYELKKDIATTFAVANQYTYTINLTKTGISFTTSYSDWTNNDVNGGDIGLD
ncbi:fimbrillin family protein [Bacteroides sp. 51]|uniref:fimbrillin family protein n=1 Tax=Bacteroides sp. 51 TaxID=2302938 RepID=UPI0013D00B0C|nr:fimbrillin family protein [Bacteroides sp. 51]NDV80597.1 hypothetical protein [Bacteroides sp. 51]